MSNAKTQMSNKIQIEAPRTKQAVRQSPFPPPLEKGDRGGFEIATLPLVARNDIVGQPP